MRKVASCLIVAIVAACGCQRRSPERSTECRDGSACGADAYCEFSPGLCGKGKRSGTCRPRPSSCEPTPLPVCGCDGKIYDSECAAHRAGVDLSVAGGCKATIPDFMPCGRRYCDAHTSYCEIYLSDVFEIPTTYNCRALPESCRPTGDAPPSCSCFPKGTPCLSFCGPMATGGLQGFHLTCQGVKEPREAR